MRKWTREIPSLQVLAALAWTSYEEKLELLTELEPLGEQREKSVQKRLDSLEKTYFDVVWVSRRSPEMLENPAYRKMVEEVKSRYRWQIYKLEHGDDPDFQCGYANGMLACTRLIDPFALPFSHREEIGNPVDDNYFVCTRDTEIADAEAEFPFLDT